MTITLTKDLTIAGVSHKKGDEIEATEAVANLLADCRVSGSKAKKKSAKKATSTSDG